MSIFIDTCSPVKLLWGYFNKKEGLTVCASSHYVAVVATFCLIISHKRSATTLSESNGATT